MMCMNAVGTSTRAAYTFDATGTVNVWKSTTPVSRPLQCLVQMLGHAHWQRPMARSVGTLDAEVSGQCARDAELETCDTWSDRAVLGKLKGDGQRSEPRRRMRRRGVVCGEAESGLCTYVTCTTAQP